MKKSHFLIFRPVSLRENYWVFHYKINDVEKEKSPSPIEYWLMLSFLRGQNWWENMTKPVCSVPESEFGCLQHATIHQKGANILGNVNIKGLHKLWNPAILDGRTRSKCGEPGKTLFMIQSTLFATQNTLIVNQMTQNTIFSGIYGEGWKIHNIGEHDPGSAEDWRTSSDFWEACQPQILIFASHQEWFYPWHD